MTCRVAAVPEAPDETETPETRLLASARELVAPGRVAEVVEAGLPRVPVLGEAEVVVEGLAGFRVALRDDAVGLVVAVLEGDEVNPPGTVEVRRAAEAKVDFCLSSSETDG